MGCYAVHVRAFGQADPMGEGQARGRQFKERLLQLYELLPFHKHPLWLSVESGKLTRDQIILAERQHFLRTRAGQSVRKSAMERAGSDPELLGAIIETYMEECTDACGPSHLELAARLACADGSSRSTVEATETTPGNAAAIAMYESIGRRGAACHIIGAGVVEHFYSKLCPRIFDAYLNQYGFSAYESETYRLHSSQDESHADRAFSVLGHALKVHGEEVLERAVRDALVATSLHYDGMLQAALGRIEYWNGRSK